MFHDIIKQLKDKSLLSTVVKYYIKLESVSFGKWKGLCPFHKEKTPSFYVNDEGGYFKCFGCGEGGDIITFVTKIKGVDFQSATRIICDICNIPFNFTFSNDLSQNVEGDKIISFMSKLATAWRSELHSTNGSTALTYIRKFRKLQDETINFFQLGYCKKNYSADKAICREAGLLSSYNRLLIEDRLIIPICDIRGRVIAFGGRALNDGIMPKYINTSDNLLFKKGDTLFNIHNAIINKDKSNNLLIVEGYFDVISAYQAGIKTAVAPLGTSLTENQLLRLLKYDTRPVFAFDNDRAGRLATFRVAKMLLKHLQPGIIPCFFQFKQEKDFDELCNKKDINLSYEYIKDNSIELQDLLVMHLMLNYDIANPNEYALVLKEVDNLINDIADLQIKNSYRYYLRNKFYFYRKHKTVHSANVRRHSLQIDHIVDHNSNLFAIEQQIISLISNHKLKLDDEFLESYLPNFSLNSQKLFEAEYNSSTFVNKLDNALELKWQSLLIDFDMMLLIINKSKLSKTAFAYERKNILEKKKKLLYMLEGSEW